MYRYTLVCIYFFWAEKTRLVHKHHKRMHRRIQTNPTIQHNTHTQTKQKRHRDGRTSHPDSVGEQPGRARRGQPTCVPRPRDTFKVPHGGTDVADEDDLAINCRGSERTPQRHNNQAHGGVSNSCDLEHDEAAAAATPTTPSAFGKTCGKTWDCPLYTPDDADE